MYLLSLKPQNSKITVYVVDNLFDDMIVSKPIYKKSKYVMKTYTNEISLVIAAVFSNKLFFKLISGTAEDPKNKTRL